MRIAIIGAGIAGLIAAVSLQRDGHDVQVYEQHSHAHTDGAGLSLFGNALAALDAVGMGELIRQISYTDLGRLKTGQRTPDGSWLLTMPQTTTGQLFTIHRVTLHQTLMDQLRSGTVHTGTRATVEPGGAAMVNWTSSTAAGQHEVDLVLVTDGIRSENRKRLGLDTGLAYSGYTAWRGVTRHPVELAGAAAETWGSGAIFGYTPLPDDQVYWFGTLSTPEHTQLGSHHQAVTDIFADWHAPIAQCLAATESHEVLRHDVYDLAAPLRTFRRGHCVLLGDAAHAMLPNLGQGAGQGIEDAVTLTLLLRGTTTEALDRVLDRYTALRHPRTTTLWRQSRSMARVAQASGPVTTTLRNTVLRMAPSRLVGALTQRLHSWTPPRT